MNQVVPRAYRILRPMTQYIELHNSESYPLSKVAYLEEIFLALNEYFIGLYEVLPSDKADSTVVTNLGLHLFQNETWLFIPYDAILADEAPGDKAVRAGLVLSLPDNRQIEINISGGTGKFRDRYEFLRFLNRVTDDLKSLALK